jgi:hypothetical protein
MLYGLRQEKKEMVRLCRAGVGTVSNRKVMYNLLRMKAGIKRVATMSEYHHTLFYCLLKHRQTPQN